MRRFALSFGMFLTLTAGVWGSALAVASACCTHESATPSAPAEHDCCRANVSESNTRHSESQDAAHDAAHETSTTVNQAQQAHAGMNCCGAGVSSTPETAPAAIGQRGLSCAECCAGGSGQTPATAVIIMPEQNRVKRDAGSDSVSAGNLFALMPTRVSHFAPAQHAPPAPAERRHILIGVFLI